MDFQTEYQFTLPRGYNDQNGECHRQGTMRLATAGDEISAISSPKVKANPDYITIVILSKVIKNIGNITSLTPEIIEKLYLSDMQYLQNMYQTINEMELPKMHVQCPYCGKEFEDIINF